MGTRKNLPMNIDYRREGAKARQAAYDALTIEQKLAGLPQDGAKRQRARLEAQGIALQLKKQKDAEAAAKAAANPKRIKTTDTKSGYAVKSGFDMNRVSKK